MAVVAVMFVALLCDSIRSLLVESWSSMSWSATTLVMWSSEGLPAGAAAGEGEGVVDEDEDDGLDALAISTGAPEAEVASSGSGGALESAMIGNEREKGL